MVDCRRARRVAPGPRSTAHHPLFTGIGAIQCGRRWRAHATSRPHPMRPAVWVPARGRHDGKWWTAVGRDVSRLSHAAPRTNSSSRASAQYIAPYGGVLVPHHARTPCGPLSGCRSEPGMTGVGWRRRCLFRLVLGRRGLRTLDRRATAREAEDSSLVGDFARDCPAQPRSGPQPRNQTSVMPAPGPAPRSAAAGGAFGRRHGARRILPLTT
jgi:hypothetical protein